MKAYFNINNVKQYNMKTKANHFELNKFTLMKNSVL